MNPPPTPSAGRTPANRKQLAQEGAQANLFGEPQPATLQGTSISQQASAARNFLNTVIRASAGTGKTFQLTNRYLGLLAGGVPPDAILATTFTRKAAGEILDRVISRLALAASDPAQCQQLAQHLKLPAFTIDVARQLLCQLTAQLHRLRISTLDGYFSQIAKTFSLELGLPPGWQIVEETDDSLMRAEAIEGVLREQAGRDLLTLVNLLTKGEATRGVSQLIRETVDNLYSLFLETDESAWKSLPHVKPPKIDPMLLAEQLSDLPIAHKSVLKGVQKDIALVQAGDWETLIEGGVARKLLDEEETYYKVPLTGNLRRIYEDLIEHARAVLVTRIALQTEGTYDLLLRFHRQYQRLKHSTQALRFDDVTHRLAQAAAPAGTRSQQSAYRLDGRIDHLLLDEFQDTSLQQWLVLRPLAQSVLGSDDSQSFFCVGDGKQAIYGWRGGIAELFDSLPKQLPGLDIGQLNESRRSSPAVIETVNRAFAGFARHPNLEDQSREVERRTRGFPAHATARKGLAGYAVLRTAKEPDKEKGEKADQFVFELAAQTVAESLANAPHCSVGVLVRTNASVARMMLALGELHIPASEEGGNPLTDSAAVELILSALALAEHPGDTAARFHVATSPLGKVVGLVSHADHPLARQVSLRIRRGILEQGLGPVIAAWVNGLEASCNTREWNRLRQLVTLAHDYGPLPRGRIDDFIETVRTQRVADPSTSQVRVMTVHQAKGLEFDVVVLPELDEPIVGQPPKIVVDRPDPAGPVRRVCRYASEAVRGLLPDDFQAMFDTRLDRQVAESLCVLYVALTRAVHALHMIIAPGTDKLPKKYSGLLRAALVEDAAAPPETVLFETGDYDWYRLLKPQPAAELAGVQKSNSPLAVQLASRSAGSRRGLNRVSPSQLEGGAKIHVSDLLGEDRGQDARRRGTLMHAWLEHVTWLEDGLPSETTLQSIAERHSLGKAEVAAIQPDFNALIKQPSVRNLLSREHYLASFKPKLTNLAPTRVEVENERPFAICQAANLLQGTIDRLVTFYAGDKLIAAEVIDFKTDRIDNKDADALNRKVEYYRPQLDAYRQAVAQSLRIPVTNVFARLVFVSGTPQVVELDFTR